MCLRQFFFVLRFENININSVAENREVLSKIMIYKIGLYASAYVILLAAFLMNNFSYMVMDLTTGFIICFIADVILTSLISKKKIYS